MGCAKIWVNTECLFLIEMCQFDFMNCHQLYKFNMGISLISYHEPGGIYYIIMFLVLLKVARQSNINKDKKKSLTE